MDNLIDRIHAHRQRWPIHRIAAHPRLFRLETERLIRHFPKPEEWECAGYALFEALGLEQEGRMEGTFKAAQSPPGGENR